MLYEALYVDYEVILVAILVVRIHFQNHKQFSLALFKML